MPVIKFRWVFRNAEGVRLPMAVVCSTLVDLVSCLKNSGCGEAVAACIAADVKRCVEAGVSVDVCDLGRQVEVREV